MLSEEEKKAIHDLKILKSGIGILNCISGIEKDETDIAIETILNLIEKQSKEIEELKSRNQGKTEALEEWINGERVSIHCIHKNKIKAKIEELKKENEQNRKDLERAINFSIFNNIREKIFINMCIKDTLKSLLEKEE